MKGIERQHISSGDELPFAERGILATFATAPPILSAQPELIN
jgi:hypothetical protein